jgi:hypothetical protein
VKVLTFAFSRWRAALALVAVLLLFNSTPGQALPSAVIQEYWRAGFSVPTPAAYTQYKGLSFGSGMSLTTSADAEQYFVFPLSPDPKELVAARINIIQLSGNAASATLSFDVYSSSGDLRRTLTQSPVDVLAATPGEWITLSLPESRVERNLAKGEYMAFHLSVQTNQSFSIQPIFEVAAGQGLYFLHMPFLIR